MCWAEDSSQRPASFGVISGILQNLKFECQNMFEHLPFSLFFSNQGSSNSRNHYNHDRNFLEPEYVLRYNEGSIIANQEENQEAPKSPILSSTTTTLQQDSSQETILSQSNETEKIDSEDDRFSTSSSSSNGSIKEKERKRSGNYIEETSFFDN